MSKFEEEYSVVIFNNVHPDYLCAMEDVQMKKMYLTALIGKELFGRIYKNNPIELVDKVIDFQQKFMGYFSL